MAKKNILVVDDDREVLETFEEYLLLRGYDVDTAENGKEAIEKSKARYYNLALLDIKLPDMEGTELLTRMHQNRPKMSEKKVAEWVETRVRKLESTR